MTKKDLKGLTLGVLFGGGALGLLFWALRKKREIPEVHPGVIRWEHPDG